MSAAEPAVALVFSPEPWVEELHRHLAHHGGARVRQIVVEPSVALDEEYEVLVVSDRWPALTLGLVGALHARDRLVLGVFDPDEPAGKEHLLRIGVDATIAADALIGEFVTALCELDRQTERGSVEKGGRIADPADDEPAGAVVAVSGPRGSGITEIALGVAVAVARAGRSVVLVDAHDVAPALAGRLGLPLEPNLRTAVDACAHGLGTLDDCVAPIMVDVSRRFGVVAGHPSAVAAAQVSIQDVLDVVGVARGDHDVVVLDLDERSPSARALGDCADAVVGVVHASPVGVVRALEWMADIGVAPGRAPLHFAVNRAPRSAFRQEEIRAELARNVHATSFTWCPHDRAVEAAAWDGTPVGRGGFSAACARIATALDPSASGARRAWRA
jgi:MinD-like ATPase involved in chromosome partitioning or flagellar assembly